MDGYGSGRRKKKEEKRREERRRIEEYIARYMTRKNRKYVYIVTHQWVTNTIR